MSCLIYYTGFGVTGGALVAVRPMLERMTPLQAQKVFPLWMGFVGGGMLALLAAFVAGLGMTYKEERIGWRIQQGEKQILATIYFLSTFNVIIALLLGIVMPLFRLYLKS